jgi:hypothetical protein
LLGRLVTLADPVRRAEALAAHPTLDQTTLPPENSVDLSVHARGQTREQLVEMIAAAVGVQVRTAEELLEVMEGRTPRLTLVVDALDEATGAEKVAGLLAELATTGGVRLLVGTRRHLVGRLVERDDALDLDDPAYFDAEDVAAYVRRCLLLDGDPEIPTPYRGQPALADWVAEAVAVRAGRSFLVAQLVSLSLVNATEVVQVDQPDWRDRFPREVGEAMWAYLDGFGVNRSRVRDLLVPLAFAEGDGLADETLWAELASRLGTEVYRPQDVAWLLRDTSAENLLLRTEQTDGAVARRLFHEALAEYLRGHEAHHPPHEAQRRITRTLQSRAPRMEGRTNWLAADAYSQAHLMTHAAAGRLLDELVTDPGALLMAAPAQLLRVLPEVTSPSARTAARVYQAAGLDQPTGVYQLQQSFWRTMWHPLLDDYDDYRSVGQQASCLHRAARYISATNLAEQILDLGLPMPWVTRWAHWDATHTRGQPNFRTKSISKVAIWEVDGAPMVVSVDSIFKRVQVWDAHSGQPRGEARLSFTGWVPAGVLGELDGTLVVVSGGGDGMVRIWDARTGQPRGEWLVGHNGWVSAVALGEVDGTPVILSAGGHDGQVRVWDARSGQRRGEASADYELRISAVALEDMDGIPVIVSGGWDGTVRLWDARSCNQLLVIEADAEVHDIAYADKQIIVATSLGLAAFQISGSLGAVRFSEPR